MVKWALITGATSGIGLEFAKRFAKENYHLILVSSNERRLQKTARALCGRYPSLKCIVIEQDLSVLDAAECLFKKVEKQGIQVDVLVNNAGFGLVGRSEEIDIKQDEKLMILNMITPTKLCKKYLEKMSKRKDGIIVNVASTAAFQPGPFNSTYFASKAYLYSYSRAIRQEAKDKGVQIVTLCPGTTRTAFFKKEGKSTPMWAMSAEKVVDIAWEGMAKNKDVIVPGMLNQVIRLFPTEIKTMVVGWMKQKK